MTIENLRFITQATSSRTVAGDTPFEISIVIPTLSRPYQVLKLLQSIFSQRDAPRNEILVVSNLEDPTLLQVLQSHTPPDVHLKYFVVGEVGVNRARNLGIKSASGKIILFVDDDCVMTDPLFLSKHLEAHATHPQAVGIGGRYALPEQSGILSEAYHLTAEDWLDRSLLGNGFCFHLLGGNASFKSSYLNGKLNQIGFNEQIQFGGSETEFHFRLAEHGYKLLLLSDLQLRHECDLSIRTLILKGFKQGATSSRLRKRSEVFHADDLSRESSPGFRKIRRNRLGVKLALLIYRHAFELGEKQGHALDSTPPSFVQLSKAAFRSESSRILNLRIFPVMRELFYIARVHFEKRRRNP